MIIPNRDEAKELIAIAFALYKYGGTKEALYPHWLRDARIEAEALLNRRYLCKECKGSGNEVVKVYTEKK